MEVIKTKIEGVYIISPKLYGDDRGYFFESFNKRNLEQYLPKNIEFVQDNQSKSKKGVLRGLHFQSPPYDQGKLIRVLSGKVLDVVVDIRRNSKTYGEHVSIELNSADHQMVWVPPGMGHGFLTLEDDTIFSYKCTNYYYPESEGAILWRDEDLGINWEIEDAPLVSEKDKLGIRFKDFISPF